MKTTQVVIFQNKEGRSESRVLFPCVLFCVHNPESSRQQYLRDLGVVIFNCVLNADLEKRSEDGKGGCV